MCVCDSFIVAFITVFCYLFFVSNSYIVLQMVGTLMSTLTRMIHSFLII